MHKPAVRTLSLAVLATLPLLYLSFAGLTWDRVTADADASVRHSASQVATIGGYLYQIYGGAAKLTAAQLDANTSEEAEQEALELMLARTPGTIAVAVIDPAGSRALASMGDHQAVAILERGTPALTGGSPAHSQWLGGLTVGQWPSAEQGYIATAYYSYSTVYGMPRLLGVAADLHGGSMLPANTGLPSGVAVRMLNTDGQALYALHAVDSEQEHLNPERLINGFMSRNQALAAFVTPRRYSVEIPGSHGVRVEASISAGQLCASWIARMLAPTAVGFLSTLALFGVVVVTNRRARALELSQQAAMETSQTLSAAVDQSPIGTIIADATGTILISNRLGRQFANFLADGHAPAADLVALLSHASVLSLNETPLPVSYGDLDREWTRLVALPAPDSRMCWYRLQHCRFSPPASPDLTRHLFLIEDISQGREAQRRLFRRANFDALTGLASRSYVADTIEAGLDAARLDGGGIALAFLDLDHFKRVNDTLGHEGGDRLLQAIGARLRTLLRMGDVLGRWGGDEFMLVIPSATKEAIDPVMGRIFDAFVEPIELGDQRVLVGLSAGIAIGPRDGESSSELIRSANAAMYKAKREGRSFWCYFDPSLTAHSERRLAIDAALRDGLRGNEFYLHYQPVLDLHSGQIVGVEALMRWRSRTLGNVRPDEFIAAAEDTGLIVELSDWLIHNACSDLARLQDRLGHELRLAMNISAVELQRGSLAEKLRRACEANNLSPSLLEIELTERVLIEDGAHIKDELARVVALGARISIDDFGTGYSALSYLQNFPVSGIKIDKSFVQASDSSERSAQLVGAFLTIAKSMGLTVIAEGIETESQAARLRDAGCRLAQGYLLGRPMPADRIGSMAEADHESLSA